jgi:TolB protein
VLDDRYKTQKQITTMDRFSYDPAWSPGGEWIAFVSTEGGNDEIFLIRPDGSDLRRLTTNTWEWDKHPTWSPDGSQIVFWSNRESGRRQLWIMNADGSNPRELLESPYNDWDPIWVK